MGERLTYRWKTRPYVHQVRAVKTLLSTGWGGALLMAPRTGKTKTFIDYASILYTAGKIDRVLIFCPVSVLGVWQDQFAMHCPVPYRLLVWDKDARKEVSLPRFGQQVMDVVVMNYDALSTPGRAYTDQWGDRRRSRKRGGRFDVYKQLSDWQPHLIGLDESHRIKTPSAKKSTMIHRLGKVAPYRVIMTGTVVTKKKRVFDVWSQWQFLNPERFPMTFGEFKSNYGRFINRNGYEQWLANRDEVGLRKLVHLDSFAITREECFDLPPRLPAEIHRIPLTTSGQAYDDMATEMIHMIETGEVTEATIRIVQSLRLRQIASGVARTAPTAEHPKGRLHRVGTEKIDELRDMLIDLQEAGEKVVIAAHFTHDIQAIMDLCESLKITAYRLDGKVARGDRDKNIRLFREYDIGCAAFVMQPQAGSLGIDLSTAGTFIWFSLTSSYVDYTQAEDRIALNTNGTRFVYLLAEDTIDELLYQVLLADGDVARAIMRRPESILRTEIS